MKRDFPEERLDLADLLAVLVPELGAFGGDEARVDEPRDMAVFAMTVLLLALGITWIASSYISSEMPKEELERRGRDNVLLLAER
ncbi:MAG: hypothetical protein H5U40_14460, partial [Polyangiaceae bacterium]|nr:hypothetical protein [Polyangiaceae bacterium]